MLDASLPSVASSDQLLRRLEWAVIRRMDGLLQGDWRTLMRGGGVDLADLREYQSHDDVRHIDWNVTARLQVPHVRLFLEDRDLSAWFLLDLSGSIDFGSGEVNKLGISTALVATLARVITRHGNRVGALMYSDKVDTVLPPGSSRGHVLNLLQRMRTPRPAPKSAKATKGQAVSAGTSLGDLLKAAEGVIKRRSLVIVVSDFISNPGWPAALARLSRKHDVVAVRVLDPLEMVLPDVGLVTVQDAETGEQLFIDASDPAFLARYAAIAEERELALRQALAESGADTLEVATDDEVLDVMLRFADLRRQRARLKTPVRFPAAFKRALPASTGVDAGVAA
jgi:uncharacterized protein (DUF58 family)